MRIVNHKKTYNDEWALVPVTTYLEEPTYILEEGLLQLGRRPMMTFQDGQYNMELNMLLFIARQKRGGMPPKKPQNAPQGPCYNCGSYDHWARKCPSPKQPRPPPANQALLALARYCLECGITHLVAGCYLTIFPP